VPKPDAPPTLYDLAREAGVSLATASRVINGSERRVAEPYRQKVLAAAARIGYNPNLSAQAVARGTSRLAALLVSDIADPFFAAVTAGVSRAAEAEGLLVTMSVTDRRADRELELLRGIRGFRPRLVLLIGSRPLRESGSALEEELRGLQRAGAGVVVVGHHRLPFASVRADDAAGGRELAAAVVASGRRRVGILAGPEDLGIAVARAVGFRTGLADAGLEPVAVLHGNFGRDGGHDAALAALDAAPLDALLAVNDVMAIGALAALRERGVAVPGEVAVTGFDDIASARDAVPALSTVHIDLEELGERAVAAGLAGDDAIAEVLPVHPVLRSSTGH
jgi:LacI family transcriptional regulator